MKCTLIVKNLFRPSSVSHSAAKGFRLSIHAAAFSGSIRPGLYFSSGPDAVRIMSLASVLEPGLGLRRRITEASYRYATRMLPPGSPPSWLLRGAMSMKE